MDRKCSVAGLTIIRLSWQIVPADMFQMLANPDGEKTLRVIDVVMKSIKLNIASLK